MGSKASDPCKCNMRACVAPATCAFIQPSASVCSLGRCGGSSCPEAESCFTSATWMPSFLTTAGTRRSVSAWPGTSSADASASTAEAEFAEGTGFFHHSWTGGRPTNGMAAAASTTKTATPTTSAARDSHLPVGIRMGRSLGTKKADRRHLKRQASGRPFGRRTDRSGS